MDWTDDRLQERFDSIDRRFDGVDKQLEAVDKRFDKVDGEIHDLRKEMNLRFDSIQRMMFQGSVAVVIALLGVIGAIVGVAVTPL